MATTFTPGWSLAFYIGAFLATCLCGRIYAKSQSRPKRIASLIIAWLIPTLLAGFRFGIGTDYPVYASEFRNGTFNHYDIASRAICAITRLFTTEPQAMFTVFAGITNFFIVLSVVELKKLNPKYVFWFLATYLFVFYPLSLNIIRQGLALAMVVYSMLLALRQSRVASVVIALLAVLAHTTAVFFVVFLAIYFVSKPKHVSRNLILFSIVIVISFLLSPYLKWIPIIGRYFGYLRVFSIANAEPLLLLSYVPFLGLAFFIKGDAKPEVKTLRILFALGAFFEFVLSSTYASRCALYLSSLSTILFPMVLENISSKKHQKIITKLYLVFVIAYFVAVFCIHGRAHIFPYAWVF